MESKIRYSAFSWIITVICLIALVAICFVAYGNDAAFYTLAAVLAILVFAGLYSAPLSIAADGDYIYIKKPLRTTKIRMDQVQSVELFQPTMGAIRICGSGGYFGYWGIFREGDIGRYSAAYGRASDCFLVRMKNGDKYVLGCSDPASMVDYINSHL